MVNNHLVAHRIDSRTPEKFVWRQFKQRLASFPLGDRLSTMTRYLPFEMERIEESRGAHDITYRNCWKSPSEVVEINLEEQRREERVEV